MDVLLLLLENTQTQTHRHIDTQTHTDTELESDCGSMPASRGVLQDPTQGEGQIEAIVNHLMNPVSPDPVFQARGGWPQNVPQARGHFMDAVPSLLPSKGG